MADNGNRRPNDFRSRNNKRRREPPIIDGSATEVPLDAAEEPPEAEAAPVAPAADPVLFGGALRPAESAAPIPPEAAPSEPASPETAAAGEPAVVPSALDGEPAPGEPTAATPSVATTPVAAAEPEGAVEPGPAAGEEPPAEPTTPMPAEPVPSAAVPAEATAAPAEAAAGFASLGSEPPRTAASDPPAAVPPAAAPSGGGAAWLLGLSNLVLLGALAWVLYSAQGHDDRAALAGLQTKVAALEARPDAGKLQGDVSSLGGRLGAADADRQNLAKSVAGLTARLDAVAQQAQGAKADADRASSAAGAAQSDANRPAPTGDAAPATVGALSALSAKLDGVEGRVTALAADGDKTAKAVADLPKPVPPDFGPTDAKIAALGASLGTAIAAVDAKANNDDARLNGFDAKVNAVDGKVNGFDARANGIDARANAMESKETEQAAALDKLRATVADLPKVDLGPLEAAAATLDKRVASIEAQLSAPKDGSRVTAARAVGGPDFGRATPIALVGQAVGRAVADGRPYASDLGALKALGADPEAVAKLQPFAATGAPSAGALKAQWDAVRGDVLAATKPAAAPGGGSVLDQLGANALSLVRVRQVGAVPADESGAAVGQVDAALAGGDVAGALAAWAKLPPAGQERSKAWAAAARAKLDAAGAAQALVDRAIAALGKAND